MKINEIIRTKRMELNMTQEQVANYLGVSASAVNKWEKNISYPDITLLPALARLLHTDLNTLLSFKGELTNKEITLFLNELSYSADKEGFEKVYDLAMEKIKEYPTCYSLILSIAIFLDGAIKLYNQKNQFELFQANIDSLYKRVLSSQDTSLVNQAKYFLISKHIDKRQFEEAKEMLQTLPDENPVDKKSLQVKLYMMNNQLDQAAKSQEEKILYMIQKIQDNLLTLMNIALQDNRIEDAKYIADVSHQSAQLFDLWKCNNYIADFQFYSMTKERTKCIKTALSILKSLAYKWDINSSPLFRHIQTKEVDKDFATKMQTYFIQSLEKDKENSFIKDSPEIQEYIKKQNLS